MKGILETKIETSLYAFNMMAIQANMIKNSAGGSANMLIINIYAKYADFIIFFIYSSLITSLKTSDNFFVIFSLKYFEIFLRSSNSFECAW